MQSRAIAEAIGRNLELPVVSVEVERGRALRMDRPDLRPLDARASAVLTRELLDWNPTGPGLIEDINAGHYLHT